MGALSSPESKFNLKDTNGTLQRKKAIKFSHVANQTFWLRHALGTYILRITMISETMDRCLNDRFFSREKSDAYQNIKKEIKNIKWG